LEQGAYNLSNDSLNGHVSCKSFPKIETIFWYAIGFYVSCEGIVFGRCVRAHQVCDKR
jgi:hypothetical protein